MSAPSYQRSSPGLAIASPMQNQIHGLTTARACARGVDRERRVMRQDHLVLVIGMASRVDLLVLKTARAFRDIDSEERSVRTTPALLHFREVLAVAGGP